MITIMGAAGHTGGTAARLLLEQGESLRVLGRKAERMAGLKARGAEVMTGDAADPAHLTAAFRGADAAYALIPPDVTNADVPAFQARVSDAIVRAAADSGLTHLVLLSSVGAELDADTGPILALHRLEERLKGLRGLNVVALRPGYFFENTLNTVGLMKHQGINGSAVGPDVTMAMTATADIGAAAADALAARDFKGFSVRELLGPRSLSLREATRILGEAVGKPDMPYVQFGYDDLKAALVQMGLSASMAGLFAEMSRAFNDGRIRPTQPRGPNNTTPTRFETFAREVFAKAYAAA
jgi:uncharacterized protein YbjT (DUF2867 family)